MAFRLQHLVLHRLVGSEPSQCGSAQRLGGLSLYGEQVCKMCSSASAVFVVVVFCSSFIYFFYFILYFLLHCAVTVAVSPVKLSDGVFREQKVRPPTAAEKTPTNSEAFARAVGQKRHCPLTWISALCLPASFNLGFSQPHSYMNCHVS